VGSDAVQRRARRWSIGDIRGPSNKLEGGACIRRRVDGRSDKARDPNRSYVDTAMCLGQRSGHQKTAATTRRTAIIKAVA